MSGTLTLPMVALISFCIVAEMARLALNNIAVDLKRPES